MYVLGFLARGKATRLLPALAIQHGTEIVVDAISVAMEAKMGLAALLTEHWARHRVMRRQQYMRTVAFSVLNALLCVTASKVTSW